MTSNRVFNGLFAAAGLILGAPILGLGALLVKLQDGGPVFYKATRVGLGGRPFSLFKLRTMVVGADRTGPHLTGRNDERITAVGRLLRKTKVDELPQLFNVLRGEMNLVGPRPEDPKYVSLYDEDQKRVLQFPPGITSPASLTFRNEEDLLSESGNDHFYVQELLPRKISMDLSYLNHRSILGDMGIIVKTLGALIKG